MFESFVPARLVDVDVDVDVDVWFNRRIGK